MELRVGGTWYGEQGTIYEDIQATIDDITARVMLPLCLTTMVTLYMVCCWVNAIFIKTLMLSRLIIN